MASSDEDEFRTYVTARLPGLRRAAYLLCGDWDRGDDVVQRTITELYRNWPRARRADSIDALVRTMLVRRFLDSRRPMWARVRLLGAIPEMPGRDGLESAERLDLHAALARLGPRQRAVLVLRYFEDLSVEQTAVALGCSEGTVKSQTARGLTALRGLLGVVTDAEGRQSYA